MSNQDDSIKHGITLRQHYAGLMMQAQLIHHGVKGDYSFNQKRAILEAVEAADSLIAVLKEGDE